MAFRFAGRPIPMPLRVARSLVLLQGAVCILAAMFVVAVSALLGANNSVPFAGAAISGGGALALGAVYALLGAACVALGIALGRLVRWARRALVGLEAVLAVVFIVQGALSVTTLISLLLCIVVVALTLAPVADRPR